jgi:protein O-mannosyl-transferase
MHTCQPHRRRKWILAAVVCLLVFTVYLPTFTGDFILDDHVLVKSNPYIRQYRSIPSYFAQEDGIADRKNWGKDYHTGYYRPLINLSYYLDYQLWGMDPRGYRATNLAWHLLACLILYRVLAMMLHREGAAAAAVLVFGIHPVLTEAVSFISSRNNIITTVFSLLCLYHYARSDTGGSRFSAVLSPLFFAGAVFSKEFGVMVLPVLFLYNRYFRIRAVTAPKEAASYLPFIAVIGVYFWMRGQVTGSMIPPEGAVWILKRIWYAPYLIMANLQIFLIPVHLHSLFVVYPPGFMGPESVLGMTGVVGSGYLLWRYRRMKILLFSVLGFAIGLFPVLNIVTTASPSLVSLRWLYFPSVFLMFVICDVFGRCHDARWAKPVFLVAVLGLGGYSAYMTRYHWQDDASFFKREVLLYHNMNYASGLANTYHDAGAYRKAERFYRMAIEAFPGRPDAYIGYSALLVETGRPQQALAVIESGRSLVVSKRMRGEFLNNKGMALLGLGQGAQALAVFEEAVATSPGAPSLLANLGGAYAMAGNIYEAVRVLRKGVAQWPESVPLVKNLALACAAAGDRPCARQALSMLPDSIREADPGLRAIAARLKDRPG